MKHNHRIGSLHFCAVLLACGSVLLVSVGTAHCDTLIMQSGARFEGKVELDGDSYLLTTPNGGRMRFPMTAVREVRAAQEPPPSGMEQPAQALPAAPATPTQPPTPPEMVLPGTTGPATALTPEALFAKASPAVVRVVVRDGNRNEIGLGSGFFVSSDGTLVTNHHVVKNAASVTVLLSGGQTFSVDSILAWDEASDLAVLKVKGNDLRKLDLVPMDVPVPVGARVYAIGNPEGLTNSISEGLLSGVRQVKGVAYLQTSAAISPGSSGGPLLDTQARVVGVTTFILAGEERVNQNLNFAVPSPAIHALILKAAKAKPVPLTVASAKALDRSEIWRAFQAIEEGRDPEADAILKRLASGDEGNPVTWFARGYRYLRDPANITDAMAGRPPRDFALAETALRKAIALAPDVPEFHNCLGFAYSLAQMYAAAVECHKRAIVLQPDYVAAYSDLGCCLRYLRRFPESVAAHLTAIRLNPKCGGEYLLLCFTYLDMHRYQEALQVAKTALPLLSEKHRADGYEMLGTVYWESGNRAEAIRTHETLRRLYPARADLVLGPMIYGK